MSVRTAISIGNFDGVHLGHAALVERARSLVGPRGRIVVLSFDPHPRAILKPGSEPARLTRFPDRVRLLESLGASEVHRLTPDRELLRLQPRHFVDHLVDRFSPDFIVEGPDFRFGARRSGDLDTLRELGGDRGFSTVEVSPIDLPLSNQLVVRASSTMIRELIRIGRVRDASMLLGRPYAVSGPVVQGDQRGRDIGIPTANVDPGELLLPADGIYAGLASLPDGRSLPAAISIGTKPTFGERPQALEAHILDYDGPLDHYDWPLSLAFTHWIRDQIRYADVDALVEQIRRDVNRTRTLTSNAEALTPAL